MSAAWTGGLAAGVGVTTATVLIQLQQPLSLTAVTADPPEDLTILRMVGDYTVTLAGVAAANWSLALLVADVTWTPGATISVDNDKRVLWQRTYNATNAVSDVWLPPGTYNQGGAGAQPNQVPSDAQSPTHLDITPRVRVEPGKALYLVAYENNPGAGTLVSTSVTMRVLYKRSGRR